MTQTTIRRMSTEEVLGPLFRLTSYSLHPSPPFRDEDDWADIIRGRKGVVYFAMLEGDEAVATVAGSAMTQQVRGELYDASGVWGVVTDPAARGKGYCRRLIASLLAAHRDEGRPLSCLYPFRASFYERLGYVKLPLPLRVRFDPKVLLPLLKKDLGGEVELMLIGDGYDTYRSYLSRLQRRIHGMAMFVHGEKERAQRTNRSWLAVAKVDGEVVGLMLYRLEGQEVTQFTLRAHRFYYDNSRAKYLLLQWISRHVDQASEVELWLSPFERPETWLADLHVSAESFARGPMGRVVDVAGLAGMEIGPGRFTARVSDPLCPWNEAVWRFETEDGRLRVGPGNQADSELTIQAMAALIYGTHDPADFVFRNWGDPPEALRATMRTMFPPQVPYLHEMF
ncbi:MAG: GNAT family N-acetyltransferase [Anaerolineae bacterium]